MSTLAVEPLAISVTFDADTMWVDLADGRRLGIPLAYFPRLLQRLVQAWAELHSDELHADWQMVTNGEEPCRIPPLQ